MSIRKPDPSDSRSANRSSPWSPLGVAALLLLAACSPRPFVVDPPVGVAQVLQIDLAAAEQRSLNEYNPDPRAISLCYSSQLNRPDQVLERARSLCPYGGKVTFYDEDSFANGCGLFQPQRVTFICTPGPKPPTPYDE